MLQSYWLCCVEVTPSAVLQFASWLSGHASYCITHAAWLLWPQRFRVSYWYIPWHLPLDLAVALAVVLLGLDAAKAMALILQSLWLDFICPALGIEGLVRPPRETLAFRAFAVALPREETASDKHSVHDFADTDRSELSSEVLDGTLHFGSNRRFCVLYPPSASFNLTIHRHPDGLPHVGKRPLRPLMLLDPLGTLPTGGDDHVLLPFAWRPGQPVGHPYLGDAVGDVRIRVEISTVARGVSAALGPRTMSVASPSPVQANPAAVLVPESRPDVASGDGSVPMRASAEAPRGVVNPNDMFAMAASLGIDSTFLPIIIAPAIMQPVQDPNSVLRAATLTSVFRCPALPLQHAVLETGRTRSAAQLLAAAERRVLWLSVPEMWKFQEPDELSRFSDEVRVRHRLALLADDMDTSVFDHAAQVSGLARHSRSSEPHALSSPSPSLNLYRLRRD